MPMRKRKTRQGTFAGRFKESVGEQFLLELFEGQTKRAVALRFDGFHDELIFAAQLVDIDAAAGQDLNAVFRFELQAPVREFPADAFDLRVGIFESEVAMAAGDQFCARDFA